MNRWLLFGCGLLLWAGTSYAQTSVTLVADRDNTLYESETPLSNGAGIHLFAGVTGVLGGSSLRRALLYFDVAGNVPAGATVTEVELMLYMSRTIASDQTVSIYPVTTAWGEGTSDAPLEEGEGAEATTDDATWLHSFFDTTPWTTPGGDFDDSTPSASTSVGDIGAYTWGSTPEMVADVQAWLDTPANNFGWIVIGGEGDTGTAKRFDSRENGTPDNRPTLTIFFDQLPIELTSFTFTATPEGIVLAWDTQSERLNQGFEIQRSVNPALNQWDVLGFVPGHGTTSTPRQYRFTDDQLPETLAGSKIYYRLKQLDQDGTFSYSPLLETTLDLPESPLLLQNTPNPVTSSTRITYALPAAGFVDLTVYDVLGREVRSLVRGEQEAGRYTLTLETSALPAGLYLYTLQVGRFAETRRMVVVR